MDYTELLNLRKPRYVDPADIMEINRNFDDIDAWAEQTVKEISLVRAGRHNLINRLLQVWQRGTTITNPVNTYIADRLKLDGNGTFSARLGANNKPIGGAILTGNIDCRYIMEHIDFEQLDGKELTFSYSFDGQIKSNTFIANVANCPFDGDGRRIAAFTPGAGMLEWFNLDIGDKSMPFVARPIPEELALCQRYCLGISLFRTRTYYISGTTALSFSIPTPVMLRIMPSISDIGGSNIYNMSNAAQTGFIFSIFGFSSNGFLIQGTKTSHGLTDGFISLQNAVFDAEI